VERSFFDTNILVYTDDPNSAQKASIATDLIEQHLLAGTAVLSTQVLQEYFVVTTRKIGTEPPIARRKIELFSRMGVVQVDAALILAAIDLQQRHPLSFWDALILQAASASGCAVLYSEDMQDGGIIAGVRVVNPFA
jgi:predicted nucleic acid-binding protein